jgi:hypothetical protein
VVAGLLPRQREYSRISIRSKDTDRVLPVFGVNGSTSETGQDSERGLDDDDDDDTVSAAFVWSAGGSTDTDTVLLSGLVSDVPLMVVAMMDWCLRSLFR